MVYCDCQSQEDDGRPYKNWCNAKVACRESPADIASRPCVTDPNHLCTAAPSSLDNQASELIYIMATYQTPESKKQEFRKYLEKSGVIDALTKGITFGFDVRVSRRFNNK